MKATTKTTLGNLAKIMGSAAVITVVAAGNVAEARAEDRRRAGVYEPYRTYYTDEESTYTLTFSNRKGERLSLLVLPGNKLRVHEVVCKEDSVLEQLSEGDKVKIDNERFMGQLEYYTGRQNHFTGSRRELYTSLSSYISRGFENTLLFTAKVNGSWTGVWFKDVSDVTLEVN